MTVVLTGGSILELKNFVAENFICSKVVYATRLCNKAHVLAEFGLCVLRRSTLHVTIPSCIEGIVASDLSKPCMESSFPRKKKAKYR